ncbi:MAG: hypothetical protein DPW15_01660 [Chloroflexi bacterium]|nr:hypothetical protein [Chloroflexota bacterium]
MTWPFMKILYFSLGYSTHDHRFLKAISDGGHEVYFVQLEGNQRQVESRPVPESVNQVIWKGGREPFGWSKLPALVLDFKRLLRDLKPDLVHAGPIQTCALIAVLAGASPLLTMSWGFDLMDDVHKSKWMEWVTRYTLRRADFFTSDANITRDKAVAYGMNPDKTVVIPWGVDLEHSAREREDMRLILLGGGSQGANIRKILQGGGVEQYVTFGGQISQADLPYWYHQADLYISPSHVDGSSVSLMEALACGLPCLVSDIPANKEWIVEDENGWLFRDGDADHLAEKILAAMNQRRKLPGIGRAGRSAAEKRADWKKNAAALMEVYRSLVK